MPDGRIQSFFRRVDRFNDSVKQEWLTDGFEEAELLYTKYDPYAMQDEWTAKNGMFPGYNCRITAMSLFGDFLSVSADSQINTGEAVLFVDEETLKTDPDALGGSSLADFRALYSSMKAEDTTEIKRHVQTLSLIHISEPTRRTPISYAVFCLKKKKKKTNKSTDKERRQHHRVTKQQT